MATVYLHSERLIQKEIALAQNGHPPGTRILTPTGWREIECLLIGDRVIGSNGRPQRLVEVRRLNTVPISRVTFLDRASVLCASDHLWLTNTPYRRNFNLAPQRRRLSSLDGNLIDAAGNRQHFIPLVGPVELEEPDILPLDPYLLGLLLGDGGLTRGTPAFTTIDQELLESIRATLPADMYIRQLLSVKGQSYNLRSNFGKQNPLTDILRDLGVWNKRSEAKSIPDTYKFGSLSTRISVLQGLMDTDGHVTRKDANVGYTSSSSVLAQDVRWLILSLGGVAKIAVHKTPCLPSYRMSVGLLNRAQVFRLARKLEFCRPQEKYPPVRAMASIEPAGTGPVIALAVDAPDGQYVTEDCIVAQGPRPGE